jgi:hypothetical protein
MKNNLVKKLLNVLKGFGSIFIPLYVFLILFIISAICFLILSLPEYLSHNQRLKTFAQNLYDHPLPLDSEVIDRTARVTSIYDNQLCDFVVEQTLTTGLSREAVEDYYSGLNFPDISGGTQLENEDDSAGEIPVMLEFEGSQGGEIIMLKVILVDSAWHESTDLRCRE